MIISCDFMRGQRIKGIIFRLCQEPAAWWLDVFDRGIFQIQPEHRKYYATQRVWSRVTGDDSLAQPLNTYGSYCQVPKAEGRFVPLTLCGVRNNPVYKIYIAGRNWNRPWSIVTIIHYLIKHSWLPRKVNCLWMGISITWKGMTTQKSWKMRMTQMSRRKKLKE